MKKSPLKRGTKQLKRTPFKVNPQKPKKNATEAKNGRIKGKSKSISKLKKELWVVFSKYIRQRDNYTCVTCGKKGEGSGMHAGHFITKSVGGLALYFHEDNVHAQCYRCNIHLSGNWTAYRDFILRKFGEEKEKELLALKGKITKWTEQDYLNKTEYYKKELEKLSPK